MKLKYTGLAKTDLKNIASWIAEESPVRARSFTSELRSACKSALDYPESNQSVSVSDNQIVRRKVYGNYLIFYRVVGQTVEILRVLHGAQNYSDLF